MLICCHLYTHILVRITTSTFVFARDLDGEILSFSDARTLVCWVSYGRLSDVSWQGPGGSSIAVITEPMQALPSGNQILMQRRDLFVDLYLGPDYNSPRGKYCCSIAVVTGTSGSFLAGDKKCVTLSKF